MITQKQISEQLKAVIEGILVAGSSVEQMVAYLAEEGATLTSAQRQIYTSYLTQLETNPDTPMPEGFTLRTQDDTYTTPTAKILHSLVSSVCLAKSRVLAEFEAGSTDENRLRQAATIDREVQDYIEGLIAPFKNQDLIIPLSETSPAYQTLATAIRQNDVEDNLSFHTKMIHDPFLDVDYTCQSVLAYQAHLRTTPPEPHEKLQQLESLADRLADTDTTSNFTPAHKELILEAVKHRQAKLPISREQFKNIFLAFIDRALMTTTTAESLRDLFVGHFASDTASKETWLAWITNAEETNPNPPTELQLRDTSGTNGSRAAVLVKAVLSDASHEFASKIIEQLPDVIGTSAISGEVVMSWAGRCAFSSLQQLFSDILRGEQGKTMAAPYGETSSFVQRLRAIREDIANDRPVYINPSEPLDILTKTIQHFDYATQKQQIAASLEGISGQARNNIESGLDQAKTAAQFQDYIGSPAYKADKAELPLNRSITTALEKRKSRAIELITEIYQNFHGVFTHTREKPSLDDVLQRYNDPDDKLKIQLYRFRPKLAQLLGEITEIRELQTLAEGNPDASEIAALQMRLDILPYKHQIIVHCNDYEQRLRYSAAKILQPQQPPLSEEARAAVSTELDAYRTNSNRYENFENSKLAITIEKLNAVTAMKQEVQNATTVQKLAGINHTYLNDGVLLKHRDGKTQLFALKVLAVITSLGQVLRENKTHRRSYFNFDEDKLIQDKVTSSKSSLFVPTSAKKAEEIKEVITKIPRGPGPASAA